MGRKALQHGLVNSCGEVRTIPASLTWVDHDAAARQRSLQILALFDQKESRDELGLGGIRDSFADQLFPGTSTIQTRLRYMLIIPWTYIELERRRVAPVDFAQRADSEERRVIESLQALSGEERGIFGGASGKSLKRLPGSVYWSGLVSWGILTRDLSQDQYYMRMGEVYRSRDQEFKANSGMRRRGDDEADIINPNAVTWHPALPKAPDGFPQDLDVNLTPEEAGFILDRIQRSHPRSLLAHLAVTGGIADIDAPWEHPDFSTFAPEHQELLAHARMFSEIMHGAALIYNIALSDLAARGGLAAEHRERYRRWSDGLDDHALRSWDLARLWELTQDQGHTITHKTMSFVEEWVSIARGVARERAPEQSRVRSLIRTRERSLKHTKSRFTNRLALERWSGSSGLRRLTYRWSNVNAFLRDLYAGFQRGAE